MSLTPEAFTFPAPITFPLARKFTLPVGVPPFPVTLAVNVMGARTRAGFGETVSAVCVVACATVSGNGADALPRSLASPLYVATIW